MLACIRRPPFRGSSKISGLPESLAQPGIPAGQRLFWTHLEIQAAEFKPKKVHASLGPTWSRAGRLGKLPDGLEPPTHLWDGDRVMQLFDSGLLALPLAIREWF